LSAGPHNIQQRLDRSSVSCRIVSSQGFYPVGHKLDPEYDQRWNATLVQRLSDAGRRLADILNEALRLHP